MVEDPLGGVILIGGASSLKSPSDYLHRLAHAGEGAKWTELPQRLSVGRYHHVAILIPDSLANCTYN